MTRHNFILTLLIAILIGLPVQPVFAQKTSKIGKKGKMIELQSPAKKQLLVEVTLKGGGTFDCPEPGANGTWRIDRKYSATINLPKSLKEPFAPMMSEPGTASEIIQAKVVAKAKANPVAAFNTTWYNSSTDLQGGFEVNVFIDDERKKTIKQKTEGNAEEERTITEIWKAERTGRNVGGVTITLDRQLGVFRVTAPLHSEATMLYRYIDSSSVDDELSPLPKEQPVFDLPRIEGVVESEVIIPFDGDIPTEKSASFVRTVTPHPDKLKGLIPGVGIPESTSVTVTVSYRFQPLSESKKKASQ